MNKYTFTYQSTYDNSPSKIHSSFIGDNCTDVIQQLVRFLLNVSYHETTIKHGLENVLEELNYAEEKDKE